MPSRMSDFTIPCQIFSGNDIPNIKRHVILIWGEHYPNHYFRPIAWKENFFLWFVRVFTYGWIFNAKPSEYILTKRVSKLSTVKIHIIRLVWILRVKRAYGNLGFDLTGIKTKNEIPHFSWKLHAFSHVSSI